MALAKQCVLKQTFMEMNKTGQTDLTLSSRQEHFAHEAEETIVHLIMFY